MNDEQDKALVRKSVTEALSFLRSDQNLAKRIIAGEIRAKKKRKSKARRAAALCAAAAALCVIAWHWPAPEDVLLNETASHLASTVAEKTMFIPEEWQEYCPRCDRVTLWLECCFADGYTKDINQQSEIQYHQADGLPCGFYSVYASTCRFCTKCGNVYVLSDRHLHAVVHQNCGAGTSCPCAAYWKEHAAENTGYQKALEQYEHKSIY